MLSSPPSLPGPVDIWHGFQDLTGADGGQWPAVAHTVRVVLMAWVIGAGVGCFLGLLLALKPTVASWGYATVDMLRSLPVVVSQRRSRLSSSAVTNVLPSRENATVQYPREELPKRCTSLPVAMSHRRM